ncbi:MAG: bifunctional phosphopantothenoylcysteine decarboxylase/phosphopantothenate--cysteine ligase CoaBC [Christensenellaceae bacterium]|nr:bifunctional phosphopantothenoylcysteine decarboxylase/phosphopantothenate--cysteine ligase CoaBC [Christensenellaceae bacterium]
MPSLSGKNVVMGVTAGIAAYKSLAVVSGLKKLGAEIDVIMTENACNFVSPLSFQTLSGRPVTVDMFKEPAFWEVEHIALARKADVFLVAPATANFIGKYANGIADDMLTTTVLATKASVALAPAMNTAMWEHIAVQENISKLKQRGALFIGPASGMLACGEVGAGRMESPEEIIKFVSDKLLYKEDLKNINIIVTAGPAKEAIDPVRFISNHSSGKMGYAIADAAKARGANVTLVSGASSLPVPKGVEFLPFNSTADLLSIMQSNYSRADIIIQAAAPADFTPKEVSPIKIKKAGRETISLELSPTVDIAKEIGEKKQSGQVFIGFAAETNNGNENAIRKLDDKNLDLIVLNDITQEGAGFNGDTNIVCFITKDGSEQLPLMTKQEVAHKLLDRALSMYKGKSLKA